MRTRLLLCLLGAATLVTACGGDDDDAAAATAATTAAAATTMDPGMDMATTAPADMPATAAPADAPGGSSSSAELPMEVTIEISDFTFGPEEVSVAVGGTITWVNNDDQAHTATVSGAFDTGSIPAGESVTVTVEEPGTFAYICAFHPFMTGTVVVG